MACARSQSVRQTMLLLVIRKFLRSSLRNKLPDSSAVGFVASYQRTQS